MMKLMNRLIEAVKSHPELYNPNTPDFMDYVKKKNLWRQIADELGLEDGKSARNKWRNLRDSYVKHLRINIQCIPGSSIKRYKNWPWADQMEFLKPHIGSKWPELLTSYTQKHDLSNEDDITSIYTSDIPGTADPPPPKRKRTQMKPKSESHIGDFQLQDMDAEDLLFLSYARTLKTFTKRRQMLVKMEISRIMQEAEMVQATEDEQVEIKYEPEDLDDSERETLEIKSGPSFLYMDGNECTDIK